MRERRNLATSWVVGGTKPVCAHTAIRLVFAEGKIGGTPDAEPFLLVHGGLHQMLF